MEKMRFDAMIRQDTITLSRLLANDLIFIHTNGVVDSKSSLLKSIAARTVIYQFILPEKSTTRVEGNFGWVYGKANIRFKVASINMIIDQYISFINFYRLIHDQWLLVACENAKINTDIPDFGKPLQPQVKKSIQPIIY
ncbi:MAG TPA: nuclear transport factor 2 family protein [Puia sp.]